MGPERRKDFEAGNSRGCALGKGEKEVMSLIEEYLKEKFKLVDERDLTTYFFCSVSCFKLFAKDEPREST